MGTGQHDPVEEGPAHGMGLEQKYQKELHDYLNFTSSLQQSYEIIFPFLPQFIFKYHPKHMSCFK